MSDEFLALEPVYINGEIVHVNKGGELWRWITRANQYHAEGFQKMVNNPDSTGYTHLQINGKHVFHHRIIAKAFLGLDLATTKCQVDHINRIKHDNRLVNLRLVTHQQNAFNTGAKGISWNKTANKWQARICVNGKSKSLGYYVNEEDARSAYLAAKEDLHIM